MQLYSYQHPHRNPRLDSAQSLPAPGAVRQLPPPLVVDADFGGADLEALRVAAHRVDRQLHRPFAFERRGAAGQGRDLRDRPVAAARSAASCSKDARTWGSP